MQLQSFIVLQCIKSSNKNQSLACSVWMGITPRFGFLESTVSICYSIFLLCNKYLQCKVFICDQFNLKRPAWRTQWLLWLIIPRTKSSSSEKLVEVSLDNLRFGLFQSTSPSDLILLPVELHTDDDALRVKTTRQRPQSKTVASAGIPTHLMTPDCMTCAKNEQIGASYSGKSCSGSAKLKRLISMMQHFQTSSLVACGACLTRHFSRRRWMFLTALTLERTSPICSVFFNL